MNTNSENFGATAMRSFVTFVRRLIVEQRGDVLPMLAVSMIALMGMGGITVDVGRAYVLREQLQNSTNAAALAASGAVYNTSTTTNASAYANSFSSTASGDANYTSSLGTVTSTVTTKCLNSLLTSGTCTSTGNTSNAVQVTQSASLKTSFMSLLGVKTLTVNATATASMQGVSKPWNVAIIVDTTGSMASTDSNCGNLTELQCALSGVQVLLGQTNPCPAGVTSCTTGANFSVSLFTFPNVLTYYNGTTANAGTATSSVSNDINCNGSPYTLTNYSHQPIAAPYTLPKPGAVLPGAPNTTYLAYTQTSTGKVWTSTYQITPFLSDYYNVTTASNLNSSSQLVEAVGNGSTSGCLTYTFGIDGNTGQGSGFGNTYLAGAIYAAQSALIAEQAANPGSQNALIILTDGDMNASQYAKNSSAYGTANSTNQFADANQFPEGGTGTSEVGPTFSGFPTPSYYTPAKILAAENTLGYDTLSSTSSGSGQTRSGTTKGTYPDWYDQCQQAIVAAQYAISHSTAVYAVAYGAGSSGCNSGWTVGLTDTTLVTTGPNASFTLATLTPCVAVENMASSLSNFYSDYAQSGSSSNCLDNAHNVSSLSGIFQAIAATFSNPRLLPNNAQ
jgi:Flp pilus assembly protein TadG